MANSQPTGKEQNPAPAPVFDLPGLLELSATMAHEHRVAFAQSFASAVVLALRARSLVSAAPAAPLDLAEQRKAETIAAAIAELPAAEATRIIGGVYTALLPESVRARHGIFYTPPALVECLLDMAAEAGLDWKTARVLDPACGGGAFLVGVAQRMMRALNGADPAVILRSLKARLKGFDIDPFGAWLAQAMVAIALDPIARAAGRMAPVLTETRDSLELRQDEAGRWDLVVGNPPYGRVSLPPHRRAMYARSIYGHANLYAIFTEAALHWVKKGGVVGFLTPPSMLSGLYYKALRGLLASEAPPLAVNFVSERDGVFADVLQETMLATYRKGGVAIRGTVGFIDAGQHGLKRPRRSGSFKLPEQPQSPWLLPRTPAQEHLARRLRSMPYRLADYGYAVSTGPLVWNRHKRQFRENRGTTCHPVVWAEAVSSDGRFLWRSQRRNHLPWFAAERPKDDWLIVTQPCVLLQRTTAKEQSRRLIAAVLPEEFIRQHGGVIVENHLNMVRARDGNPGVPPAVIAALLNSAAADAAFRCINGSVAVSAFELEELPLPGPAAMMRLARLVAAHAPSAAIDTSLAAAYGRDYAAAA